MKIGKKIIMAVAFVALFAFSSEAQRIATVDIQTILESVDDYKGAQDNLDRLASKWRQEIAQEYDQIKGLYNKYQAEQVLLSDESRRQREDEIMEREKQVRELQRRKFGPEGELFKRRQELVKPIQDRVYQAIEDYAADRGYDFIFDKGGSAGLIFSNGEYDKTEDVIRRLK